MTFQPGDLKPGRSARDLFGAEIRRHRERAGMSLRRLAEVVTYSKSQLARYETAESLPYDDLPAKLDACFGTDGFFAALHAVAKKEPFPGKYRRVSQIERRAAVIEEFAFGAVPGLLQTPEVAELRLRYGHPYAPDAEVKALVRARLDRQARLSGPKPPRCWFILDESTLRRPVGGPEVMCNQCAVLIQRAREPHITIQVLPFSAGQHPQLLGGTLMLYTVPNEPLIAYEEISRSGAIFEDADTVAQCRESYDLLRAMALSPRESEAMIRAAMEDWTLCEPPRT